MNVCRMMSVVISVNIVWSKMTGDVLGVVVSISSSGSDVFFVVLSVIFVSFVCIVRCVNVLGLLVRF